MKKLFVLTVCVLLLSLRFTFAYAVKLTCEWTGAGDGANYSFMKSILFGGHSPPYKNTCMARCRVGCAHQRMVVLPVKV